MLLEYRDMMKGKLAARLLLSLLALALLMPLAHTAGGGEGGCSRYLGDTCDPAATTGQCCRTGNGNCVNDGTGKNTYKCLECIPDGSTEACGDILDCCTGLICNGNTYLCVSCLNEGEPGCSSPSDCCSGLACNTDGGICVANLNIGERTCSATSDCVSTGRCELRSSQTLTYQSCVLLSVENEWCAQESDCASELVCDAAESKCKQPACQNDGETCAGNSDCCQPPRSTRAMFCDSLNRAPPICRECVGSGESCGGAMACCSPMTCGTSNTCEGGWVAGSCPTSEFGSVVPLAGLAALATAILIALTYMFGEFTQSARAITWAKTEAVEMFVSLAAVALILFVVSLFCTVEIGEAASIFSRVPYIFNSQSAGRINLYQSAQVYLEHLMGVGLRNMAAIRYNLGAYEMRTAFTKYECDSICWLSMTSTNVAIHGGETLSLAVSNSLLGTATVSYLTAVFEYFTFQYIEKGIFLALLPLAIVIRSIPFMRNFGGALIGIMLALYIFYPLMLVANAVVAPSLAQGLGATIIDRDGTGCRGIDLYKDPDGNEQVVCVLGEGNKLYETNLEGIGFVISDNKLPTPSPMATLVRANTLIFVTTVFLAAINFVVVAALARDLSRFLGEEADISRLGQMV